MIIFGIIISLFFSALFSGTEIAFISANKLNVEIKKSNSRNGRILERFFERPHTFLSTMLVGNNIALVVFTTLFGELLMGFLQITIGIQNEVLTLFINTILITLVVLFFGEFYPKNIFRLFADDIIYALAVPLRILQFLLYIPAQMMNWFTMIFLKLIHGKEKLNVNEAISRFDLEQFIKSTSQYGDEYIDTELFEKALHLKKVRVKDCMIPRNEITCIDVSETIDSLLDLFLETKLSRILVYKDDINEILGYVHHQQLLKKPKSTKNIILEITIVPEQMSVRDLMETLIKQNQSIACIVDEFGAVSGIITLEDILEEIFGEIADEFDDEDYLEERISDKEYLFSGRLEVDYLNEKYPEIRLPVSGNHNTLSGYLVMTMGEIPNEGQIIELDSYKFVLETVSDTKIETVRIIKLNIDEKMD